MNSPFTIRHYHQLASTNSIAMQLGMQGDPEYTVVICDEQTAGRGQRDTTWESEAGKNLTFSLLLRPFFIPSDQLFILSKAFSVAVCQALKNETQLPITIKWPNDIYVGDKKIAGTLLEHSFSGNRLICSVIGIGLNVNQVYFTSNAPNPTSIVIASGKTMDKEILLDAMLQSFYHCYECLRLGAAEKIEMPYLANLYRKDGYHPYQLPTGERFYAKIADVLNSGELVLEHNNGSKQLFAFKEVGIVL